MSQTLQDVIVELAQIKSDFALMKDRFLIVNERYARNMESLNALALHAAGREESRRGCRARNGYDPPVR